MLSCSQWQNQVSLKTRNLLSLARNASVVYHKIRGSLHFLENICQISKYLITILNHNNPSVVLLGKNSIPWRFDHRWTLPQDNHCTNHSVHPKRLLMPPILSHRIPHPAARFKTLTILVLQQRHSQVKLDFFFSVSLWQ